MNTYYQTLIAAAALITATLLQLPNAGAEEFSCVAVRADARPRVINTTLAGVPAVVRLPNSITHRPIVLWHGLGSPGDPAALMQALPLDDIQAVKVYLGLPLTGERAPKDSADGLAQRQKRDYATLIFKPIVIGAAEELPAVASALDERHCLPKDREIDLFGFSAGGTAVLAALAEQHVRIAAAITVNAPTGLDKAIGALERATHATYNWSPEARQLAERTNFTNRAVEIGRNRPALLMLQGADDTVSSPQDAEALVHALEVSYRNALDERTGAGGTYGEWGGQRGAVGDAQRLKVVVLPGVTHQWAQGTGLDEVRANVTGWLNRHG
ncbi:MAG: prolyl oligopeptidase family serine peptidase [Proteobacteria bacterium]|nr:prolyl oligopeptidase family serine peptidase [Pseudomonadota bacterium]